eukprot:296498-Amphidinium_carterae.1
MGKHSMSMGPPRKAIKNKRFRSKAVKEAKRTQSNKKREPHCPSEAKMAGEGAGKSSPTMNVQRTVLTSKNATTLIALCNAQNSFQVNDVESELPRLNCHPKTKAPTCPS